MNASGREHAMDASSREHAMDASGREHAMDASGRLSVFFPSLSSDILWKLGTVSRVRFAAPKARALDTAPTFPQILLRRKRREGAASTSGAASPPAQTCNHDSRRH